MRIDSRAKAVGWQARSQAQAARKLARMVPAPTTSETRIIKQTGRSERSARASSN